MAPLGPIVATPMNYLIFEIILYACVSYPIAHIYIRRGGHGFVIKTFCNLEAEKGRHNCE